MNLDLELFEARIRGNPAFLLYSKGSDQVLSSPSQIYSRLSMTIGLHNMDELNNILINEFNGKGESFGMVYFETREQGEKALAWIMDRLIIAKMEGKW